MQVPGTPSRHYPEKSSQSVHHASNGGKPHSDWKLVPTFEKNPGSSWDHIPRPNMVWG